MYSSEFSLTRPHPTTPHSADDADADADADVFTGELRSLPIMFRRSSTSASPFSRVSTYCTKAYSTIVAKKRVLHKSCNGFFFPTTLPGKGGN
jgi:hypothetical protein